MEAINRMFTPEFRNRLDSIVTFKPLPESVVLNVVDKFLVELQHQLDDKRVHLVVDDAARRWLVQKGYDKNMGARPMARVIQEYIKKPLAEMVLFGALAENGGTVHVALAGRQAGIDGGTRSEGAEGSERETAEIARYGLARRNKTKSPHQRAFCFSDIELNARDR